jgi:YfiR/HmsC-like
VALNKFGAALQAAARGQLVDGRPVETRVIHQPSSDCHIVFVPNGMSTGPYVRAAHGTLTVGESPAFQRQGGAITFVVADNRVRFAISAEAATRADVRISSRLLRLSYADQPGAP